MRRWMNLAFLLCVATAAAVATTAGCSRNGDEATKSSDVRVLITQADRLQEMVKRGELLQESTERDQSAIQDVLYDIKLSLMKLEQDPKDASTAKALFRQVKLLGNVQMLKKDKSRVMSFVNQVSVVLARTAKATKTDIGDFTWTVFSYTFSAGLEPFGTFAEGAPWKADWAQDETSYASVTGFDNKAWLISPGFDLTSIDNPSFRFRHTVGINRNTSPAGAQDDFDRPAILAEAFKVLVSQDYEGGDPENAHWKRVEIGKMPNSYDFHAVTSSEVDLKPYVGKNVSIAFVFDQNSKKLGHHYVTWQLYGFDLFGSGLLKTSGERNVLLAEQKFNKDNLDVFQAIDMQEGGTKWAPAKMGASYKFVKVGAGKKPTDTWLLSPLYKLRDQTDVTLTVKESVRNPVWENMRVLISSDYDGGDPTLATWEKVERLKIPETPKDQWRDSTIGPFDLSKFAGKDIVIALQYVDDGKGGDSVWEVGSLSFLGKGNEILTKKLTLKPFTKPAPQQPATPQPQATPQPTPEPTPMPLPTATPLPDPSASPTPLPLPFPTPSADQPATPPEEGK